MSTTYAAVDDDPDPASAVAWQERVARWPAVQAYKANSHELVRSVAGPWLDVGCGPGVDLAELGREAVGLDPSAVMCTAAAGTRAAVCRGDAHLLPFADRAFGAVRADRVLQHLAHPEAAVLEFLRVLRPGGRLVVAEPDQETLVIEVPGVRRSVLDRLKALRRDVGYRNGRLVSRLPAVLAGLGMRDVAVAAFPLVLRDPADAFGLSTWPRAWQAMAGFTDEELAEWDAALVDDAAAGFLYAVTFFVVSATAP